VANMGAKLNSLIMEIPDEDYRDLIVEEMMLPSYMYSKRLNFAKFFRDNISTIREDLYQEFQGLLEDIDYDLYTRRAIMKYQGDFSV
jgi:succinate dehydrogenase flavin-adding protein (antitoxin of CptAB toxin-antitoxin module)